jgi:hypothetical protein
MLNRPNDVLVKAALVGSEDLRTIRGTFGDGSLMASGHKELMLRTPKNKVRFITNLIAKIPDIFLSQRLRELSIETIEVPAKTLDKVFEENPVQGIDLLVLDVEGFELDALRGFGFHPKPRVVMIETRYEMAADISILILSKGFDLCGNFSNFTKEISSTFTEDHQDFVWVSKTDFNTIKSVLEVDLYF